MIANNILFCFFLFLFLVQISADYMIDLQTNYKIALDRPLELNITRLAQQEIEDQHSLKVIKAPYFLNDDGEGTSWFEEIMKEILLTVFNQLPDNMDLAKGENSSSQNISNYTEENTIIANMTEGNKMMNFILNEINNGDNSWIVTFNSDQIDEIENEEQTETIERFYITRMRFWSQIDLDHETKQIIKVRFSKEIECTEQGEILSFEHIIEANHDL